MELSSFYLVYIKKKNLWNKNTLCYQSFLHKICWSSMSFLSSMCKKKILTSFFQFFVEKHFVNVCHVHKALYVPWGIKEWIIPATTSQEPHSFSGKIWTFWWWKWLKQKSIGWGTGRYNPTACMKHRICCVRKEWTGKWAIVTGLNVRSRWLDFYCIRAAGNSNIVDEGFRFEIWIPWYSVQHLYIEC